MIVAGVMSGTSADGIDVALVRVGGAGEKLEVLGHAAYPYAKEVRRAILGAMNAPRASVARLARLNFLLGHLYADALLATQRRFRRKAGLVGCHGQTIYHQGAGSRFLGRMISTTWQTGEAAIIAQRLGVPVVSDFRPADMAAGGNGAPLVPFFDFAWYRHARIGRVAQNIGGIANLTAIPAGASPDRVIAFDTGPGNMVIDGVTERLFHKPYDRGGQIAASGTILDKVLASCLRDSFFRQRPPKTAGREEFGREFVDRFLRKCARAEGRDAVATATALTARSIGGALRRFVLRPAHSYRELIVSGGGSENPTLMAMLANELRPMGLELRTSDEFGVPAEAKEAAAFAMLAYKTWRRRPSNIPAATGARRKAILGKIAYA